MSSAKQQAAGEQAQENPQVPAQQECRVAGAPGVHLVSREPHACTDSPGLTSSARRVPGGRA